MIHHTNLTHKDMIEPREDWLFNRAKALSEAIGEEMAKGRDADLDVLKPLAEELHEVLDDLYFLREGDAEITASSGYLSCEDTEQTVIYEPSYAVPYHYVSL